MSELYDFPNRKPAEDDGPRLRDYTKETAPVRRGRLDVPFLLLALLILLTGLVMLLSSSYARSYYETYNAETGKANAAYIFIRQAVFSVVGIAAMFVVSLVPLKLVRRLSTWALVISVGLLLLVLVIGLRGGGAERWIDIGITTFQPSELVKAAVVFAFADWCCRFGEDMRTFRRGVLPFLIVLGVISLLLMLQPHLSATLIILALGIVMMFAGGTRWYWFIAGFVLAWLLIRFVVSSEEWLVKAVEQFSYIFDRINAWKDPESQSLGSGYQILQSLYAVGSGGLLGLGLGQSRQKYMYLPEEHNDYIFAIICEELGFIGATLILLLFAVLIVRGFWLALHCRDRYSSLVVTGLTALLTLQVFLNVAVVTNLLPSTGISLPFFSYGGTALAVQMAEIGVILSASREIPDK